MVASVDEDERPSWLLKQVRDLTENWEIPLGDELEKYLDQLEKVEISFDDGKSTLNFIEAAMLIQGSACVYSKKVEYLYSLAISTLEMIVSRKKQQQASSIDEKGHDKDTTFDQHKENDELLDLDDIRESDNIELKVESEMNGTEAIKIIPRIPFALMPKNEMNRRGEDVLLNQKGEVIGNRHDFKINTCILHSSGALLIDFSSVTMLEESMGTRSASTPIPSRVQNTDIPNGINENADPISDTINTAAPLQKDALMEDNEGNGTFGGDFGGHDDYDDYNDAGPASPVSSKQGGSANRRLREFQRRAKMIENAAIQGDFDDPWQELDPFAEQKHMVKPFKKGKPFKLPQNLKAVMSREKKRKRDNNTLTRFGTTQLSSIVDFCGKDHRRSKKSSKLSGAIFPEFQYLSRLENDRRKEARKRERRILASRFTTDQIADIESIMQPMAGENDDENDDYDEYDAGIDEGIGARDNEIPLAPEDDVGMGTGVAGFTEDVVLTSYEDLVRQHLGKYIEEAENYAQQTELTKRVKEWQDKILPVLEEEERHRPYDIHLYGTEILQSFDGDSQRSFNDLVKTKDRHEVCRYFLSTLLLANTNNLEIVEPEDQLEMDMLNLRLLDKTPAFKAISNYQAPSQQDK